MATPNHPSNGGNNQHHLGGAAPATAPNVHLNSADGIATGKAGASMAGHAIGDVASGLAHGDPDSIGPAIDAHAKTVEAKALAICGDMVALRAKQDAIAAALPSFKPYASIHGNGKTDCEKGQD